MPNEFYTARENVPPANTRSNPDLYTGAEFRLIEAGFDKFPSVTSGSRFREVRVKSDESGLNLGAGYQERSFATAIPRSSEYTALLESFRIDAHSLVRLDAFFWYAQMRFRLVFSGEIARGDGFAVSGDRVNAGTEFSAWTYDEGIVQLDFQPELIQTAEVSGIVVGGASTVFMSVQAASYVTGSGRTSALGHVRLTHLVEV